MKLSTVFVNGRFLTQRSTGIQNFALGICYELNQMNYSVVFITPQKVINTPSFGSMVKTGSLTGHLWEQVDLPRYVKKNNIDTLVNLGNSAPVLLNNNFITIHDLAFLQNKKWFSRSYRLFYSKLTPLILKKAKAVFTVSESSKKEISQRYRLPENSITILKNGIYNPIEDLPVQIDIPEKYFLFVGSLDPRKRLQFLIDSFKSITDKDIKLIVVGKSNPIFTKEILKTNNQVIFLDDINNTQLQSLYQNAIALVLPSLYEGFGRPILEALYNKTEVICSDIPVFKENFEPFVHFFETNELQSLTNQLNKLSINCHVNLAHNCPNRMFSYKFAASALIETL